MQIMTETIAEDQSEKHCPQCNCYSQLRELKCGHVICDPCVNTLREIYDGKIFCPDDMQESKAEDLKWKTEEEGEENSEKVTEIKLLIEKSCKQRKTTTGIFKEVAAELQSVVKKPTREITWQMIAMMVSLFIQISHQLSSSRHRASMKEFFTSQKTPTPTATTCPFCFRTSCGK